MTQSSVELAASAAGDGLVAALDETIARARGSALYRERLAGRRIRNLADLQALPLTTRADLQAAGVHGTRALPLARVCHYGESSGTTGASNSTWLTAEDLQRDADAIRAAHPGVFAAAIPLCGGGDETQAAKLTRIPIWAFHGAKDESVNVERSRTMIAAIRKAGGLPKYTEYPDEGHAVWIKAFDEPELLPWVFSQSRRAHS